MTNLNRFEDKVVYQIYPKSFLDTTGSGNGDIQGIINKLDYLKELGVDYVWLSPVNKSPQYDNGYDIADYYDIDPMFGNLADYKQLISEANKREMKIMLDLVLNHTSSEHEWFKKAIAGDEYYRDFYIWRDEPNDLETFFSKPAWTYNDRLGKYYFHLFDTHQPDLNWENKNVRKEIYKMVNFWIDLGVGGFRLDVIDLIGKEPDKLITGKGPKFLDYLRELSSNTFGDKLLTVGECWNSSVEEAEAMCTLGLTQVFHFEHLTTTNIEGNKWDQKPVDFKEVCDVILKWQNSYHKSQNWVMNNHDMPRLVSLWLNDQKRYEGTTVLATLFGLLRGTQYIYQGEEFGMANTTFNKIEDFNDVESINEYAKMKEKGLDDEAIISKLSLISRDNPRTPVNWNNTDDRGFGSSNPWITFNTDTQNCLDDAKPKNSIYKYYRDLIRFKKENFDIVQADINYINCSNNVITIDKENLLIVCNMNDKQESMPTIDISSMNLVINNYDVANESNKLNGYEARVYVK